MAEKILTMIIPMYNAKPWIRKCLRSLVVHARLRQDLEVLVVNDGSVDGCEKAVYEYAEKYPDMFRMIQKENGGHGSAVNAGAGKSRGKYLKVLDADDRADTRELEILLDELIRFSAAHKEPDVILCGYQTFDIRTGKTEQIRINMPGAGKAPGPGCLTDLEELAVRWKQYRPVCTFHGIAYRTAFYRKYCRGLPEKVCYDDAYYAIVPASHAKKIFLSASCPYVYRIGDSGQSVSARNRVRRLADADRVAWAVCATIRQHRPPGGQAYWKYRTESFLTDYLITCFLRFQDQRAGRAAAGRFMEKLVRDYPVLAEDMRRKYNLLGCMSYLHISEKQLLGLMQLRRRRMALQTNLQLRRRRMALRTNLQLRRRRMALRTNLQLRRRRMALQTNLQLRRRRKVLRTNLPLPQPDRGRSERESRKAYGKEETNTGQVE